MQISVLDFRPNIEFPYTDSRPHPGIDDFFPGKDKTRPPAYLRLHGDRTPKQFDRLHDGPGEHGTGERGMEYLAPGKEDIDTTPTDLNALVDPVPS